MSFVTRKELTNSPVI